MPYPFSTDKLVVGIEARNEYTAVTYEDGSQEHFGDGDEPV